MNFDSHDQPGGIKDLARADDLEFFRHPVVDETDQSQADGDGLRAGVETVINHQLIIN